MILKLIHKVLKSIERRIEEDIMFSAELTKAIQDLTNAVNAAIPLLGPSSNNDAAAVAALAPITASLVAAVAAIGSGTTPNQQSFTVNSVPSDLSTFVLNGPDGSSVPFQFVYAGSQRTIGVVIPLPLGATPAQVQTAIGVVFSLPTGTSVDGTVATLNFSFKALTTTQFAVLWNAAGALVASGGTQGLAITSP